MSPVETIEHLHQAGWRHPKYGALVETSAGRCRSTPRKSLRNIPDLSIGSKIGERIPQLQTLSQVSVSSAEASIHRKRLSATRMVPRDMRCLGINTFLRLC